MASPFSAQCSAVQVRSVINRPILYSDSQPATSIVISSALPPKDYLSPQHLDSTVFDGHHARHLLRLPRRPVPDGLRSLASHARRVRRPRGRAVGAHGPQLMPNQPQFLHAYFQMLQIQNIKAKGA